MWSNLKIHLAIIVLTIFYSSILFSKTEELHTQTTLLSGIDTFSISAYSSVDCGAVSIKIYYKSIKVANITSKLPGFMSRIIDTCVSFSWYAMDGITPIHFDANEPIAVVNLAEKTGEGCIVKITYDLANIEGEEYNTSLSITNSVLAPCIEVHPPITASFDTTRIDSTRQLPFTITNPSSITLQIDSLWTDSKYFTVTKMLASEQINKGDTAKFIVCFTPDSMKGYFGQLFIANNSPITPYRVLLSGIGIDSLTEFINNNLKSIQANLISGIDTFSIVASSPMDCSLASMRIYAQGGIESTKFHPSYYIYNTDNSVSFTCTNTPSVHFDAYEPIVKFKLFEKTGEGSSILIKYVLADINGTMLNNNLLVSYNLPSSLLEVHPSSILFGIVKKDSVQQSSFSITNSSIIPLQIDSLWTNTKYFEVTKVSASGQIRTGDTIKAAIQFTPDSNKTYIDTLFITNNSSVSPYKVPLCGTDTSMTHNTGSLKSYLANFISGFDTFSISSPSPIDYGVMGMWIYVKSSKITGINSKLPDFVSNIVKDTSVAIAWHSMDWITPIHFDANEPIITVTLAEKTGQGSSIRVEYEFADIQGTILNADISISNSIPSSVQGCTPMAYELKQNYPNPFNPSTTIQYGLPTRSLVRLVIYNILGQVVGELINTEQQAGIQSVIWNANVASGLYFYRIEATSLDNPSKRLIETKKMLLLK